MQLKKLRNPQAKVWEEIIDNNWAPRVDTHFYKLGGGWKILERVIKCWNGENSGLLKVLRDFDN